MGGSTVWSFVGLWAIRHLHASQSAVGVAFLISAMVGVLAGYAGGHLSDHVGRRPLILVSWGCQVALMLGFLAAGGRELVGLGLMCLGGLVFQIGSASSQAMIADLVPPDRHEQAYAAVRVAANLGITLGPPTGALFLFVGNWSALFAGAAALFFAGFLLALRYLPRYGDYAPEEPPTRIRSASSSATARSCSFSSRRRSHGSSTSPSRSSFRSRSSRGTGSPHRPGAL
jgi:predicted MFS family arabinose efflux permease